MENTEKAQRNEALSPATLAQFIGTETYTRHPLLPAVVMTDGVAHVYKHVGWPIDLMVVEQLNPTMFGESFQHWTFDANKKTVICTDGNGKILVDQALEYFDLGTDSLEFFIIEQLDLESRIAAVILLPSEY